jgi:hypothetical protein
MHITLRPRWLEYSLPQTRECGQILASRLTRVRSHDSTTAAADAECTTESGGWHSEACPRPERNVIMHPNSEQTRCTCKSHIAILGDSLGPILANKSGRSIPATVNLSQPTPDAGPQRFSSPTHPGARLLGRPFLLNLKRVFAEWAFARPRGRCRSVSDGGSVAGSRASEPK